MKATNDARKDGISVRKILPIWSSTQRDTGGLTSGVPVPESVAQENLKALPQCPRVLPGHIQILLVRLPNLEEVGKFGGLRRRSVSAMSCIRWGARLVAEAEEMTRNQLGGVGNVDGEV